MAAETAISAQHATLDADTVDTVTLSSNFRHVEVANWGTSGRIYFTTNGAAPTVGGDDTYVVGPGQALEVATGTSSTATTFAVKLICSSANEYTVTGF